LPVFEFGSIKLHPTLLLWQHKQGAVGCGSQRTLALVHLLHYRQVLSAES